MIFSFFLGEPARLLLKEYEDARDGVWIDPKIIENVEDPVEKAMAQKYLLAYQSGKESFKVVPVLIPEDTKAALKILHDPVNRKDAGVLETNRYLFPSTQNSENHVSGWHSINAICGNENISLQSTDITATKQRHRVSTLFAALEVSQKDREAFYDHMGHNEQINVDVYQAPPALKELRLALHLESIDKHITPPLQSSCTQVSCQNNGEKSQPSTPLSIQTCTPGLIGREPKGKHVLGVANQSRTLVPSTPRESYLKKLRSPKGTVTYQKCNLKFIKFYFTLQYGNLISLRHAIFYFS